MNSSGGGLAAQGGVLELEQNVLGALLLHGDAVAEVSFLQPRDFAQRRHELVYEAILGVVEQELAVDPLLVEQELAQRHTLAEVGGKVYLLDLMESVVSAANVVEHAKLVQQAARRREVASIGRELSLRARDGADVSELLDQVRPRLDDLATGARGTKPRRYRLRSIDQVRALPPLDWVLEGLLPAPGIAFLISQANAGKTTLALGLALSALYGRDWCGRAVAPGSTLYVAGEGVRGLAQRIEAWDRDHRGAHSTDDRYFLVMDDLPPLTGDGVHVLREAIHDLRESQGHAPRYIVIDTCSSLWGGESEDKTEVWSPVMMGLRSIVEQTGALVLALHHANKGPSDRRHLDLSAVRGSSSIVGSADTILGLEPVTDGARLVVLKQRDGMRTAPFPLRLQQTEAGVYFMPQPPQLEEAERSLDDLAEDRVRMIVRKLEEMGEAPSASSVVTRLGGRRQDALTAWKEACARGQIINQGTARDPRWVVASRVCCAPPVPPGTGNREPGSPAVPVPDRGPGTDGNRREPVGNRSGTDSGNREPAKKAKKARRKA